MAAAPDCREILHFGMKSQNLFYLNDLCVKWYIFVYAEFKCGNIDSLTFLYTFEAKLICCTPDIFNLLYKMWAVPARQDILPNFCKIKCLMINCTGVIMINCTRMGGVGVGGSSGRYLLSHVLEYWLWQYRYLYLFSHQLCARKCPSFRDRKCIDLGGEGA